MAARNYWLSDFKRSATVTRFKSFGNFSNLKKSLKSQYKKYLNFTGQKPFTSFFVALGLLLLAMILGSTIFRTKAPVVKERTQSKSVTVYRLSESPSVSVQGEVKKGNVVNIVALMPGVVSKINKKEGEVIVKNEAILNLSSNYQGGNTLTLQRQLAGITYKNTKDTYDIQKDLIAKQREIANLNSTNAEELRKLTQVSIDSTRTLVNFNSGILNNIKTAIINLQNTGGDTSQIQSLQQAQAQIQSGQNQLEAALRSSEYSVDSSKPPVKLEALGKEIALKQLDIQEKALKTGLQAAGIQLAIVKVQEANMFPSSPFEGVIEKINVKPGDNVNPGMVLATVSGQEGDIVIDAKVTKEIAEKVSRTDTAKIKVNGQILSIVPLYISSEATDGQLYSVIFTLDKIYEKNFTDKSFVEVDLPLSVSLVKDTLMIPIDSVFQTQEGATVYVVEKNIAKARKIELGDVTGSFVTIKNGITLKDTIITTRNVINGDKVKVTN